HKEEYERQLKISEKEILPVGEEGEAAHIDSEAEGVEGAEVIGAILVVGDGCITCAREQRAQHIEFVAGESEVLAVGEKMSVEDKVIVVASEIMVEEMFEVEMLVAVKAGHDEEAYAHYGVDTRVIEEEVLEFWMVEDESLRARTFSKGAGMMRKWVPSPDGKKDQESRRPEEAENRAKMTHTWPKRRVRARMRGVQARKKRNIQEGRAHAHWRRRAWRSEGRRCGVRGVEDGWWMQAGDCTGPMEANTSKERASGLDARKQSNNRARNVHGWSRKRASDARVPGVQGKCTNSVGVWQEGRVRAMNTG
ncbi:Unknown protein, partial [Striga hermonthica]